MGDVNQSGSGIEYVHHRVSSRKWGQKGNLVSNETDMVLSPVGLGHKCGSVRKAQ
jgi:hypothetical protein